MFHTPWAFLLFLLLPVMIAVRLRLRSRAAVRFSALSRFEQCPVSLRRRLRPMLFGLRLACIALLVVALARPRKGTAIEQISTEGVAMMVVVDRSSSMGAAMRYGGQELTRLDVVKQVASDFIEGDGKDYKGRVGDMIGLVTYARYADTNCPLVRSGGIIADFLQQTRLVVPRSEEDRTSIGDGIALAAARLQKAEKQLKDDLEKLRAEDENAEPDFTIRSKVIILLTDGINNAGQYQPIEAAKLAMKWGIKIYTIGIGSPEDTRGGFFSLAGPSLDERLLQAIAQATGGFYARADNAEDLRNIYKKIDELEKTKIKSIEYMNYAEQFSPWALAALAALAAEILAGATVFRKIP